MSPTKRKDYHSPKYVRKDGISFRVVTSFLPVELCAMIDEMIDNGYILNRSEFIRNAVIDYLSKVTLLKKTNEVIKRKKGTLEHLVIDGEIFRIMSIPEHMLSKTGTGS